MLQSRHIPGKNRAFWSETFHCKVCKKPRPKIYQSRVKSKCKVCYRKYDRQVHRAWRARINCSAQQHSDRARKAKVYPPLRRARDMVYKIRRANIYAVPDWVNLERDLLPLYELAYKLDKKVKHIVPIKARKNVCGLHTPANLYLTD